MNDYDELKYKFATIERACLRSIDILAQGGEFVAGQLYHEQRKVIGMLLGDCSKDASHIVQSFEIYAPEIHERILHQIRHRVSSCTFFSKQNDDRQLNAILMAVEEQIKEAIALTGAKIESAALPPSAHPDGDIKKKEGALDRAQAFLSSMKIAPPKDDA